MKTTSIYDTMTNLTFDVLIGENAQDNWDVIDKADQFDIWFHIKDQPSSHVLLKLPSSKTKCSSRLLFQCAQLCKNNSKCKNISSVTVIYTERKNINKQTNKIGAVIAKKTNKIIV